MFNTENQWKPSWLERTALACDLLSPAIQSGDVARLSDIGCGDQKLRRLVVERGWSVLYQGFDLLPQSDDVRALNLELESPPGRADVATVLGVLEYVDDIGACLQRLAVHAPLMVVSHTLRDGETFGEPEQQARGWKNHLYAREFHELLSANAWNPIAERTTTNGRTRLWMAERADLGLR